jgi:heme exporter protein B
MKKQFLKELKILLKKEFLLEWRTKVGLQSIFLYTLSTVFLCYWAIHKLEPTLWVALFWIILVFSALNAAGRSFLNESSELQLYYFGMASPNAILLSKMIFNGTVMLILTGVLLFFFSITLGFPIQQIIPFIVGTGLGVMNISSAITFLSAVVSKASNNLSLLAILGIPVLLPILFVVIHFSIGTLMTSEGTPPFSKDLLALILMNLIVPSVSMLIFPYIWRN